jgi:hypothetical protein
VTPSTFHARAALAGAMAMAAGAFAGSASALMDIAGPTHARMSLPPSLVLSLDGVALVAAFVVHGRPRDWWAWLALLTATALSTALQVASAPPVLIYQAAHAAPPVFSLVAFHLAMRVTRPAPAPPVEAVAAVEHVERPNPPADAAPSSPEPGQAPKPAPRSRPRPAARTRPVSVPFAELVPVAEQVAAELAAAGRSLSRRSLQDGLRAAGHPVGTGRATQLLDHLRNRATDPAPLELVEATS